jgi:hypothetical protein
MHSTTHHSPRLKMRFEHRSEARCVVQVERPLTYPYPRWQRAPGSEGRILSRKVVNTQCLATGRCAKSTGPRVSQAQCFDIFRLTDRIRSSEPGVARGGRTHTFADWTNVRQNVTNQHTTMAASIHASGECATVCYTHVTCNYAIEGGAPLVKYCVRCLYFGWSFHVSTYSGNPPPSTSRTCFKASAVVIPFRGDPRPSPQIVTHTHGVTG